jgi:TPR repeat protein
MTQDRQTPSKLDQVAVTTLVASFITAMVLSYVPAFVALQQRDPMLSKAIFLLLMAPGVVLLALAMVRHARVGHPWTAPLMSFDAVRLEAEKGDAVAQNVLGYCYGEGRGIAPDHTEAVKWFQRAAHQGNPEARYNMGECFEFGKGLPQNDVEAYAWYLLAAPHGVPEAGHGLTRLTARLTPEQRAEAEALAAARAGASS